MGRRDGAGAETLGAVVVAQGEGLPGLVGDAEVEGADGGTGCEDLTGGAGDDGDAEKDSKVIHMGFKCQG